MRVADDVTRMAGNAIARTVESELDAIREGWKADRAELTRLRKAIEEAPHEETCATNKYDSETLENAGYPTIKCTCWKRELDKEGKA